MMSGQPPGNAFQPRGIVDGVMMGLSITPTAGTSQPKPAAIAACRAGFCPAPALQHLPDDHRVNGIRGDCTRPSAPRMAIPPNGVASSAASPLQAALRGSRRSHYEDIVGGHPAASGRPKVTSCNSVIRTPGFRVTHIRQHYCRQTSCAMASLS